jgi:hypothetical protein
MNYSFFSKTRLVRIIVASLMLSVYICTVLINYASREITKGNFVATVVFLISIVLFSLFSSEKKHPPLLWAARGWLMLSVLFCFLAAVITAAEAELNGFFGNLIGCGIMLFVSPYFGIFFVIENTIIVGLVSMLISFLLLFLPMCLKRIIERRKLIEQYK